MNKLIKAIVFVFIGGNFLLRPLFQADGASADSYTFHWNVSAPGLSLAGVPVVSDVWGVDSRIALFPYYAYTIPGDFSSLTSFNGGLPQLAMADLDPTTGQPKAFQPIEAELKKLFTEKDYDRWKYIYIDFEEWIPRYEGVMPIYRSESEKLVRLAHPNDPAWTDDRIKTQAKLEFETAALNFLVGVLKKCKSVFPGFKWGYYGYPLRVYWGDGNKVNYPVSMKTADESASWRALWNASDVLFPSIYQFYVGKDEAVRANNQAYIGCNVAEAVRCAAMVDDKKPRQVLPFIWSRYHNSNTSGDALKLMQPIDIQQSLFFPALEGADGVVIWGYENDKNPDIQKKNIADFSKYLDTVMNPFMKEIQTAIANGNLEYNIVKASPGPGGTITPGMFNLILKGFGRTFQICPYPGFNISDVLHDHISQGTVSTLRLDNVIAPSTIEAYFISDPLAQSDSDLTWTLQSNVIRPLKGEKLILSYWLTKDTSVSITVYDRRAEQVIVLAKGEQTSAGPYSLSWDGRNASGSMVASGTYMVVFKTGERKSTKKVVVIK